MTEDDTIQENDGKKGSMTPWAVKVDPETKAFVSTLMAASGMPGAQFLRALCESYTAKQRHAPTLPEELQFLDSLLTRVRSYALSGHLAVEEKKKQLAEREEALRNVFLEKDARIEELETKVAALEEELRIREGHRKEVEMLKAEGDNLRALVELQNESLKDLALWKDQAKGAAAKEARVRELEGKVEALSDDFHRERNRVTEQNAALQSYREQVEKLTAERENLRREGEALLEKERLRWTFEKQSLMEKADLEKQLLRGQIEVEKRNAVLEYLNTQRVESVERRET